MPQRPKLDRILIVRLSALGDVVHVLPSLDALRRARPGAHIGWLVEDRAASLVEGHPQVDRVHVLPRGRLTRERRLVLAARALRDLFRAVRAERYEVAIDFQGNLRSATCALLSGARARVGFARGFCKEASYRLQTIRVTPPRRVHKVEKNFALLRALGIDTAGARPRLAIPPAARARIGAALGDGSAAPIVALHPGVSKFGAFKQWPAERYAAVARYAAARGARVIVTWGPGERALAEDVATLSEGAAAVGPETSSILELAAIYERCAAVVGCDTGPIHLAAALGVPVIGLYGPKDPRVYGPWGSSDTVFKQVHCSPCTLRWCGNVICMDAIAPDDVNRRLSTILSSRAEVDRR